jgi:hypothetical protein
MAKLQFDCIPAQHLRRLGTCAACVVGGRDVDYADPREQPILQRPDIAYLSTNDPEI